jgi:CheY-like chemotaxis protein
VSGRDARILVIEDDETLRETLAEVLIDEGHEVRAAAHGDEALDYLDGWVPDLIVLDLMMPTMDAYEFRERQRQRNAAPGAPTLVISAARDIQAAAARLEADDWIAKPFLLDEVIDAIDRLLARSA